MQYLISRTSTPAALRLLGAVPCILVVAYIVRALVHVCALIPSTPIGQ